MRQFFLSVAGYFSKLRYVLLLASMPFFGAAQSPSSIFVHFDFNNATLSQSARASLDSLTDSLDVADRIELHGHCDAIGSNSYNDRLSVKRVNAVQSYLLSIGWDKKDILIASGHGENNPVVENSTAENRSMNRRVEIKIIYGQAGNTVPVDNVPSLSKKIADTAVKAGTKIILKNINFAGGLHRFLPESFPMLEELLKVMQTYPSLIIQVEGHICCNPGPGDGLDNETGKFNLSEARAKAVKDYLVENGIKADRISYKGFGHSAPLYPYPESSLEQEKLNRRVEIKIISK